MASKIDIWRAAAHWLEEQGHEAHVRGDYSGRAMYGDTVSTGPVVTAIVTDAPGTLVGFAIARSCVAFEYDEPGVVPVRADDMGHSTVWY